MSEQVELRFYAELCDLLPAQHRSGRISHRWVATQSVKDLVESYGVPHTEVDIILAGGRSVAFDYRPAAGDRRERVPGLRVVRYRAAGAAAPGAAARDPLRARRSPRQAGPPAAPARASIVPTPPTPPTRSWSRPPSGSGASCSRATACCCVVAPSRTGTCSGQTGRTNRPARSCAASSWRGSIAPFTRCPACNGELVPVEKAAIEHRLPPGTRRTYHDFRTCPDCGRDYWQGAHHARLERLVADARSAEADP